MKEKTIRKIKKQVRGITLIALVVTIIVLLILAAVAINLTIGENGIFTKAQTSVEKYNKKSIEEEINMYWGEVQLNYEDTLEEQVKYLQTKLREQDQNAIAIINDENIDVTYKGTNIKIPYMNKKIANGIKFFNILNYEGEIWNYYCTLDNKVYVQADDKTTCILDIPQVIEDKNNIEIVGEGSDGKEYLIFHLKKQCYKLYLTEKNENNLVKVADLNELENGKFKNKNISFYIPFGETSLIFFDDGTAYEMSSKQEIDYGKKIINMGTIMENGNIQFILIDANGQMNMMTQNGLQNINNTFANVFFYDKKVSMVGMSTINDILLHIICTDEGKAYSIDENGVVTYINDLNEKLKDKKIVNINMLGDSSLKETYITFILEDGNAYYTTPDFKELISINVNGFPEFTPVFS